jgi:hypothetical protein
MAVQPGHRSILVVDVEGFTRDDRTGPIQLELRQTLRRTLQDALAAPPSARGRAPGRTPATGSCSPSAPRCLRAACWTRSSLTWPAGLTTTT